MRTYNEWLQNDGETEFRPIERSNMPQDPDGMATGWNFKVLQHGGAEADAMPQWIEATDADGRSAVYEAMDPANPADRPQDTRAGGGLAFQTRDHDGDNVPQTIIGTDADGREIICSPLRNDEGLIGRWELVRPTGG